MKKQTALLLALFFIIIAGSAYAQDSTVTVPEITLVEDTIGVQEGTELIVGSTTQLAGYFSTDMWGTNTSDIDVRALLHGYSTVAATTETGMTLDATVVSGVETQVQSDGSRIYTITINEGLTYNDGTPITAKDYVFSLLLCGSPEVAEIGGTPRGLGHLTGYEAYRSGEAKVLGGVKLVSEYAFSLQIGAEYFPYFYGLSLLDVTPYPISVIAPGCDIMDDGNGVYIGTSAEAAGMNAAAGYTPGVFSAEMLNVTMLDLQTGYVFNPRVTSGPYSLESYDSITHIATFVINENYKGNYEGQKPHIERLVFKPAQNETMVSQLANGEYGLLNKVANMNAIIEGLGQSGADAPLGASTYLRTGFAFLAFDCADGVTASEAVRKAVAYSFDKQAFASGVGGAYALPVYGYYGLGQWMSQNTDLTADAENDLEQIDAATALAELEVPLDLDQAKALLAADGWTLNASGGEYAEGVDSIRYRSENGSLVPLTIRWAKTANSSVADAIAETLREPFGQLGLGLEITEMPFNDVLALYYSKDKPDYDMFYLATNFTNIFDPYYEYNTADEYQGLVNTSGLRDETLMMLALDMRRTEPSDMRGYVEKWLAFQERWVELMPMVPLYSNVYFDFYQYDLQDYKISMYSSWALAIPYAWIGEPVENEETPAGMDEDLTVIDDDEFVIIG